MLPIFAAALFAPPIQDSTLAILVHRHLAEVPVEAFRKDTGQVSVAGIALLDIDGDGTPEVFVAIHPSYRQTPTILVFRRSGSDGLERLPEGLAPGRLQPVSGHERDAHTLGEAIDMTVGHGEAVDTGKFVAKARESGISIVRYRGFFHGDMREGFASYLDLADRPLPAGAGATCATFEFSRIDGIATGRLGNDTVHSYLVVLTSDDMTVYRFAGIDSLGRLAKQSWMYSRPRRAAHVLTAANGDIQVTTEDGSPIPLKPPQ